MAVTKEEVQIQILLEAASALKTLTTLKNGTEQYNVVLEKVIQGMKRLSAATGEAFSKSATSVGKAAQSLSSGAGDKYIPMAQNIAKNEELAQSITKIDKSLEPIPKKAHNAAQGFNVLHSAMGFLVAMGMSAIANAFVQMFKKIIDSASQAEQAFIKLSIAEKSISQLGVDITPQELTDIIEKVNAAYLSVSKIDAQKMVSSLAVLTKDLKLSAKEYEKLAMAIPLVAQQAGVTIDNATNQVITGLTKSGRGWADLGITVDAAIIRQKAVSAGIVESKEAYEALTAEQKQQVEVLALLQILEDNTTNNKAEQEKYNNSLAGSQTALNAAWEDFAATLGKISAPTIIQFLQSLTKTLINLNTWFEKNGESSKEFSANLAGISAVWRELAKFGGAQFGWIAALTGKVDVSKTFKDAYEQAKKYNSDLEKLTDTPTGVGGMGEVESEADTKRQEAFDKFAQELAESEIKLAQEREEIAIDLGRTLADIETEYDRKRADANRDYADKVRDINQSYSEDIADIEQKQAEEKQKKRNDDLKREQEYQNKLLEMRENYLMSLEDALHSRDARQVLKLMRQYELDKLQAARRHEIDQQQADTDGKAAQRSVQIEINKAKAKRDIALKAAAQDREDKLAQLAIDEKREIADAKLKTRRKLDDLRKENADRMAMVAAQLVQEYKLTGDWMLKMVGLYHRYYGNIAQVYQNIAALQRAAALAQGGVPTTGAPVRPSTPATRAPASKFGLKNRAAEGGTFIANRPTSLEVGEAGMEAVSVMPLGRLGKNVNSVFTNLAGGGAGAGKMTIELLLSPDLESRIVANSLDQTANIVTRTMRGK